MAIQPGSEKEKRKNEQLYKTILQVKKIVVQLLHTFVKKKWVQHVTVDNISVVDKEFFAPDFKEKRADLVYKVDVFESSFYILIELQSTVNFLMPYRLENYKQEIRRFEFKNKTSKETKHKDFLLPSIVSIVLYNGGNDWTAKRHFAQTLTFHQWFRKNDTDFEYILIDVNRCTDEELLEAGNLISSIFYVDKKVEAKDIMPRLYKLSHIIKDYSIEDFDYVKMFIIHQLKSRLPKSRHDEVDFFIGKYRPWRLDDMLLNLQLTLDEMIADAKKEAIDERNIDVVMAALKKGLNINIISEITGLSKEKVLEIKNKFKI